MSQAHLSIPEVPAPPTSSCWKCGGEGYRLKKKTAEEKAAGSSSEALSSSTALLHAPNPQNLKRVPCPQCSGSGTIVPAKRKKREGAAKEREEKFAGTFTAPGPLPSPLSDDADLKLREGVEDLSYLTGHWRIFQEMETHRYSTDDVMTAWVAHRVSRALLLPRARAHPETSPLTTLDIGCGIGSVLLMTAWLNPQARCVGVEAQLARATQAWRSVRFNGAQSRVAVLHGDLRANDLFKTETETGTGTGTGSASDGHRCGSGAVRLGSGADKDKDKKEEEETKSSSSSSSDHHDDLLPAGPPFDLITGTPPYFDLSPAAAKARAKPAMVDPNPSSSSSSSSSDPYPSLLTIDSSETAGGGNAGGPALPGSENSARCLFVYRGGIEAYAVAASRWLAPHGLFVVVDSSQNLQRGYDAAKLAGFRMIARLDCVPKAGKPPLFCVFVMCRKDAPFYAEGQEEKDEKEAGEGEADKRARVVLTADVFRTEGWSPYETGAAASPPAAPSSAPASATPSSSSSSSSSSSAGTEVAPDSSTAAAPPPDAATTKADDKGAGKPKPTKQQPKPFPGSLQGELVCSIMVRGEDNERTNEYVALLRDMGKPG